MAARLSIAAGRRAENGWPFSPPAMGGWPFPKHFHLLRPAEFNRVYDGGVKKHSRGFVLFRLENNLGHPRLGLSVGRKFGNAVRRNRIKRLIREAFRLNWELWQLGGSDIVVIPKRGAAVFQYGDVSRDISRAFSYLSRRK